MGALLKLLSVVATIWGRHIQWSPNADDTIKYDLVILGKGSCTFHDQNIKAKDVAVRLPDATSPLEMEPGAFGVLNLWGPTSVPPEERLSAIRLLVIYINDAITVPPMSTALLDANVWDVERMIETSCIGSRLPKLNATKWGVAVTPDGIWTTWDLAKLASRGAFSLLLEHDPASGLYFIDTDVDTRSFGRQLRNTVWFNRTDVLRVHRIECALGTVTPDNVQYQTAANDVIAAWTTRTRDLEHLAQTHIFAGLYAAVGLRNAFDVRHPIYRMMYPHLAGSIGFQMLATSDLLD